MKIIIPTSVAVLAVSAAVLASPGALRGLDWRRYLTTSTTTSWVDSLTVLSNSDSYHTKPVRVLHARVQSDMPLWNSTYGMFGSKYYSTFETQFRGAMDTVNTASVEGALMYVQAECINYNTRATSDWCTRKNNVKYVVFYDIVFAQTNETIANYEAEYGDYEALDSGRCTPSSSSGSSNTFPSPCYMYNGDDDHAEIGPFVGGGNKSTDARAPYPNTWWYSFPNNCPLSTWSTKTDSCRSSTRRGLCAYNVLPDGIACTYNYRILGFVAIDDLVGITSMVNSSTSATYNNFSEFCQGGNVEFNASSTGTWYDSIDFWKQPQNETANAGRATKLIEAYADLLANNASVQISQATVGHMMALPTVAELTAQNPPCYYNVQACSTATYGCSRTLYSQLCTVCTAASSDCVVAPGNWTFPTLAEATVAPAATTATPTTTTATPTTTTATPTTTTATPSSTKSAASSAFSMSSLMLTAVAAVSSVLLVAL